MKKYVFLFITILCIIFIYCNSLMNSDISTAQSGFALSIIQKAAKVIGLSPILITEHIVRKLAHFCEYALLGFLMTVTTKLWNKKLKSYIIMVLFFGLLIPVTDEFLQLFVAGRAGMVQDIMLDFAGFVIGMWTYIGLSALSKYCKKILPEKNS